MFRFPIIAGLTLIAVTSAPAAAAQYDWVADFSAASNPSGVWSYGESLTLGSDFIPMRRSYVRTRHSEVQVNQWLSHTSAANIYANLTDELERRSGQGWPPRSITMHPGSGDQYAVLRFTAPAEGLYDFNVSFTGNNETGTTTDVHVLVNQVPMFSGDVNSAWFDIEPGPGPTFANDAPVQLAAGGTIDIAVGPGGNGYAFDLTGVAGWIADHVPAGGSISIPEPSSALLVACGLAMSLHYRRRFRHRPRDSDTSR